MAEEGQEETEAKQIELAIGGASEIVAEPTRESIMHVMCILASALNR